MHQNTNKIYAKRGIYALKCNTYQNFILAKLYRKSKHLQALKTLLSNFELWRNATGKPKQTKGNTRRQTTTNTIKGQISNHQDRQSVSKNTIIIIHFTQTITSIYGK